MTAFFCSGIGGQYITSTERTLSVGSKVLAARWKSLCIIGLHLLMVKSAICIGLLFAVSSLAQSSSVTSGQLVVDVRPEAVLVWQSDSAVLVRARLMPGTQVRVWADESCGAPTAAAQVVSASGTVVIQLAVIDGSGKPLVCLSSSDGKLSANLAALHN
jgi:hypothetical protein